MKRHELIVAILSMVLLLAGCVGESPGNRTESSGMGTPGNAGSEDGSGTGVPGNAGSGMGTPGNVGSEDGSGTGAPGNAGSGDGSGTGALINADSEESPAEQLRKNGAGMMVQVRAGNVMGSGVIYELQEDAAVILTAAHVAENADPAVLVTFCDGSAAEGGDVACSELADFAVVRVSLEGISEENRAKYFCATTDKESFDALQAGDDCIAMGCRTAVASEAYQGIVMDNWMYMEDYGQYMIWVQAEGKAGMSGGGLFDLQGRFLGILSGESGDGELAVVPLSLILTELDNFDGMVENKG